MEANMALVISRKKDEGFTIGDDVHILIYRLQGDKVRIAITAPDHVKILRDELRDRDDTTTSNQSSGL